jgi:restriction system protein
MVNCGKCGEKLGFFQSKYSCEDNKGNTIKCCSDCYEKFQKEETKVQKDTSSFDSDMKKRFEYLIRKFRNEEKNMELPKDPKDYTGDNCWVCFDNGAKWYKGFRRLCSDCIEVLESRLKKEKEEEEKLRGKNAPLVSDYCKKYLQDKDLDFKGIILGIKKDMSYLIKKNSLSGLEDYFSDLYKQTQERTPYSSQDYDEIMDAESTCSNGFQLIEDVTKLRKLLDKKGVKTDYNQIFDEMVYLINQDIQKLMDKLTKPAHKKISKITKTDKKRIIKEYLKLGFDEPNVMIISDLFDKFGLDHNESEVAGLLQECIEEQELEDFEERLGMKKVKQIGDFDKLNGHQFEDYLKELFTFLGYQVVRTKGSGDQGADLIIKKDGIKIVVQAKKYSGSVTNKAIQEVVASKKHYSSDKGMVVTTGKFTKSAIDLAKSNKVDLWDKQKLKQVVGEINKSKKSKKGLRSQQSSSLTDDYFPTVCSFCDESIKLKLENLPTKNKEKTMNCPECNVDLAIQIPEQFYLCNGCKKIFDTVKERITHEKSCKKAKERRFNCKSCKKELRLDDSEFKELEKKGKLNVECPTCKKDNLIKR